MKKLEDSGFMARGDHDFILVKGTQKKRGYGKLKVSNKAKDYYRVGVPKSSMHTAVLKEINSTCECFSEKVTLWGVGGLFWGVRKGSISWSSYGEGDTWF